MTNNKTRIAVGQYLVKELENLGINYVFGIPGGHILPIIEALNRSKQIQFIVGRHETGTAFMAMN